MTQAEAPPELALAIELHRDGRLDEAAAHYARALGASPDDAQALHGMGMLLQQAGALDKAIAALRRAAERSPDDPAVQHNLAAALGQGGLPGEAIEHYRRALAIKPNYALAWKNLAVALQGQARLEEAIDAYRRAIALDPSMRGAYSNLLFSLTHSARHTPEQVFAEHVRWGVQYADHRTPERWRDDGRDLDPERRLRIGYVSPDFREHAVSFFIAPLLRAHDRDAFEVTCYANVERADAVTDRIRGLPDHWRDVWGVSDADLVHLVREDEIDILVDLAGHTLSTRLLAFADRPAPVQAGYLGYANTSGVAAIDYRITDAVADPEGVTDALHTEQLVRLPHCFLCYEPPASAPEPASRPPAGGAVAFGSFNKALKLTAEVVALWARILGELPRSTLALKSDSFGDGQAATRFLDEFAAHGVAAERLRLLPADPSIEAHLARYAEVDLALDPFPYSGATTTCEALWMGVPVVTFEGVTHAARVSSSLLRAVGLDELVAQTAEDYAAIALRLANDDADRAELRAGLRERMRASPLGDAERSARDLEAAYRAMWRRFVAGARTEDAPAVAGAA
jgi:predicted O-linked N-acetylglucosamine transferase (SPINDLY family)